MASECPHLRAFVFRLKGGFKFWMMLQAFWISHTFLQTTLNRCQETGKDNTAFESIDNGASVSYGPKGVTALKTLKLPITTEEKTMPRRPIHPGEILADELAEIGISAAEFARTLEVPPGRISQILAGKRAITADTALRLSRYLGTSAEVWMNLQRSYELNLARQELGKSLERIPQRPAAPIPVHQ